MRFIAVFDQRQLACGLGFDSLLDANDFLFWGYEDHELLPLGVYDVLTDRVSSYEHAGQPVSTLSQESIRTVATHYLLEIRQLARLMQQVTDKPASSSATNE